jgi:hypothetical protein
MLWADSILDRASAAEGSHPEPVILVTAATSLGSLFQYINKLATEALTQNNVDCIFGEVGRITEKGIVDASGKEREYDVISK